MLGVRVGCQLTVRETMGKDAHVIDTTELTAAQVAKKASMSNPQDT